MLKFLPLLFFLSSCTLGPGNFQSRHSTDIGSRGIRRVAVLPPQTAAAPATDGKGGRREPATILSGFVYSTAAALPDWQVVSDREVGEVIAMVPQGADLSRVKRLGELVYADAVITGRLLRFRERVGEGWGIQSPASVAFVIDLWDAKRGDVIWSGQFDETQKPLSENIFAVGEFTQRGWRWLTAEELALEGVKKAINQLHQILHRGAT